MMYKRLYIYLSIEWAMNQVFDSGEIYCVTSTGNKIWIRDVFCTEN